MATLIIPPSSVHRLLSRSPYPVHWNVSGVGMGRDRHEGRLCCQTVGGYTGTTRILAAGGRQKAREEGKDPAGLAQIMSSWTAWRPCCSLQERMAAIWYETKHHTSLLISIAPNKTSSAPLSIKSGGSSSESRSETASKSPMF